MAEGEDRGLVAEIVDRICVEIIAASNPAASVSGGSQAAAE
jgi:hypothetical protein